MKVQAVKNGKRPGYPYKDEVLANPEILKIMPCRWKNNLLIYFMISGALMSSLTACQKESIQAADSLAKNSLKVAPIFVHGSGLRKYSNIQKKKSLPDLQIHSALPLSSHQTPKARLVGNGPPWPDGFMTEASYISEEVAFQIISEETKEAGLNLTIGNDLLGFATGSKNIPRVINTGINKESSSIKDLSMYKADALEKSKNIKIEFVSVLDGVEVYDGVSNGVPNDKTYDLLELSKNLKTSFEAEEKKESAIKAIFYDPGEKYEEAGRQIHQEEALRLQVRDFISWLKGQGII